MARADKTAAVAELAEEFRSSQAVVLTEYRGLTVKQLTALRRSLGDTARYAIVKNTLTALAAQDAGVSGLDEHLVGPSAIAFVKGDPVDAAKSLRDFARTHPLLVIKGGVMDGRPLGADEIRRLADLESREVLLAKLAGAMKASLSGAVALFAAPLAKTARTLEALRVKAEEDPSVLAGVTGQPPAPAAEVTPEPTAEVTPEPAAAVTPEPAPEVTPEPAAEVTPEPAAEVTPEPAAEVTPEPAAAEAPEARAAAPDDI